MVKVAVVGAGYWGKNLVRNFYSVKGGELKYVVDLDEKKLAKMEKDFPGIKGIQDVSIALNDPELAAVVIATPAPDHFAVAKRALEAGKHVYVEKPLTLAVKDAEELVAIAQKHDRKLMVGHLMEYHSAVNWLKDYIDRGELGDILYAYATRVNLGIVRSHENAWWSLAPHDISIILYLFGGQEPDYVSARGECYLQPGIEDVVFANLHFPDKRMAQIHVSWLDPHKDRKLTIVGKKRMVVFDDTAAEKIKVFDRSVNAEKQEFANYAEYLTIRNGDISIPYLEMKEPLALECAHFIQCIAENKTPRSDGLDGLRVVKVLDAAQKSLNNGGAPVKLTPEPALS
jgi:predicted dehydrogenase